MTLWSSCCAQSCSSTDDSALPANRLLSQPAFRRASYRSSTLSQRRPARSISPSLACTFYSAAPRSASSSTAFQAGALSGRISSACCGTTRSAPRSSSLPSSPPRPRWSSSSWPTRSQTSTSRSRSQSARTRPSRSARSSTASRAPSRTSATLRTSSSASSSRRTSTGARRSSSI